MALSNEIHVNIWMKFYQSPTFAIMGKVLWKRTKMFLSYSFGGMDVTMLRVSQPQSTSSWTLYFLLIKLNRYASFISADVKADKG